MKYEEHQINDGQTSLLYRWLLAHGNLADTKIPTMLQEERYLDLVTHNGGILNHWVTKQTSRIPKFILYIYNIVDDETMYSQWIVEKESRAEEVLQMNSDTISQYSNDAKIRLTWLWISMRETDIPECIMP